MKTKSCVIIAVAALVAIAGAKSALAGATPGHSNYGAEIRRAQVSGYTLTYTLIGVPEMNVTSVMPMSSHDGGANRSHHLMVFVTRPDGRPQRDLDVSYVVAQPSRPGTAYPAFRMNGGAGTDVDLPFRGDYAITATIGLPDADLVDTFVHSVK